MVLHENFNWILAYIYPVDNIQKYLEFLLYSICSRMFHSLINVIEQVHVSSQNTAVKQWRLYLWHMKGHFVILSHKTFQQ